MGLIRFAALLVCSWVEMAVPSPAATPEVLVAVRQDAPPFVSLPVGAEQPSGFFWDICERAVELAGYRPKLWPIDAADRTHILRSGSTVDGKMPDLICDPTTITLARMRNFDDQEGDAPGLSFSPIVFIANGSYVQQTTDAKPASGHIPKSRAPPAYCDTIISEMNSPPDSASGGSDHKKWWQPVLFPPRPGASSEKDGAPYAVWGYVKGSTIGDAIKEAIKRVGDQRIICPVAFSSHAEAAERFCEGKIFRYFGDVELIRAALTDYFRKTGRKCPTDQSAANEGTYEPYAFVLSVTCRPEFPERFTRALYAMFEDETIDRLFASHFPGSEKSQYLGTLFRINSIPLGDEPAPAPKSPGPDLVPPGCQTEQ